MIAAICLEDRNGLLFNGRRLSRDRAQQEDLMTVCGAGRLWISPFSAPLFPADVYLDLDPAAEGFVLEQQREFSGTSHPCITREIYRRGGGYGKT